MILDNQAVPIEAPTVRTEPPQVTRDYLVNTKKYCNTLWYSEAEDMKGYVDKHPFKGKAIMTQSGQETTQKRKSHEWA